MAAGSPVFNWLGIESEPEIQLLPTGNPNTLYIYIKWSPKCGQKRRRRSTKFTAHNTNYNKNINKFQVLHSSCCLLFLRNDWSVMNFVAKIPHLSRRIDASHMQKLKQIKNVSRASHFEYKSFILRNSGSFSWYFIRRVFILFFFQKQWNLSFEPLKNYRPKNWAGIDDQKHFRMLIAGMTLITIIACYVG